MCQSAQAKEAIIQHNKYFSPSMTYQQVSNAFLQISRENGSKLVFCFNTKRIMMVPHLSGSLAEDSVDEGHDGRFEVHLVPVTTCAPVQVSHESLKSYQQRHGHALELHNTMDGGLFNACYRVDTFVHEQEKGINFNQTSLIEYFLI